MNACHALHPLAHITHLITLLAGHLVGEYGLINQLARLGTLTAVDDCKPSSSMTTADE